MPDIHNNAALRERLDEIISGMRHQAGVPIGTLVDRHTVKLRMCGGHKADAALACIRAICRAAEGSTLFGAMSRVVRRDGTIDLWIEHPQDRWRSAAFTLQLHTAFRPDDLMLMVSTYVPFGLDGDTSAYPVEQSTAYKRGTQELRAVVGLQAKRIIRGTDQNTDLRESGDTSTRASEQTGRFSTEQSGSASEMHSTSRNHLHESQRILKPSLFGGTWVPGERTETAKNSNSAETSTEQRTESGWSSVQEQRVSDTSEYVSTSRSTSSSGNETVMEVTQEVSFVAVGADFTDAERLWAAWRSDPQNADVGATIELMLSSIASLGEVVEESIVATRRKARVGHAAIYGDEFSSAFWDEARSLMTVDLNGDIWPREILAHDGYPAAINHRDMEAALRQAHGQIGSTVDSARRFLEGR